MKKLMDQDFSKFECIVIGVSAGGLSILMKILPCLPVDFPKIIILTQHIHKDANSYLEKILQEYSLLPIYIAEDKMKINPGNIYIAPSNFHLLVEDKQHLALNTDEKVNFSRPSVDVMFESAADVFEDKLLAIVLTGANDDGTIGIKCIKENGGFIIAQDPTETEFPQMPRAAIAGGNVDAILTCKEICKLLSL